LYNNNIMCMMDMYVCHFIILIMLVYALKVWHFMCCCC